MNIIIDDISSAAFFNEFMFRFLQIIEGLMERGHNITEHNAKKDGPLSVIQLVTKENVNIYAKSDRRKAGYGEAGF